MLELVKYIRTVPQHEPLNSCFGREVNPGPDVQSDDDLEAWVKKYSGTASRAIPAFPSNSVSLLTSRTDTAGSCSMLPRELDGVVDPKLKVYGTENIRVVDLSVLPIQIASHAQTFVYALAEQAADIIKGNI
ncbi:hypothetical protein EWM64_g5306 [Hericium alpestre]|uniref:Glucose-methanol-choline oxidoreductase C-terminal domain-containing protein n=1 Tax=Hericium alpestre TaxID=135208 RepID=A0A4Y9ZWY3_9AGAM|nr:hypothetical protein EWM64_g5306 [Hericium alpestre]